MSFQPFFKTLKPNVSEWLKRHKNVFYKQVFDLYVAAIHGWSDQVVQITALMGTIKHPNL
jgi:hypothetical protein